MDKLDNCQLCNSKIIDNDYLTLKVVEHYEDNTSCIKYKTICKDCAVKITEIASYKWGDYC